MEGRRKSKEQLRRWGRGVRVSLARKRREEAEKSLLAQINAYVAVDAPVLSFCSFGNEVSTERLNLHLLDQGRLYLPRVEGKGLVPKKIEDLKADLVTSSYGPFEPLASCKSGRAAVALVPGLAFVRSGYRVGFGKGFYDQFLDQNPDVKTVGVAFKEQLFGGSVEWESHDRAVDHLLLV